ncbi:MAG: hypothetical protein Q9213_004709 [Squamulea squamosa]
MFWMAVLSIWAVSWMVTGYSLPPRTAVKEIRGHVLAERDEIELYQHRGYVLVFPQEDDTQLQKAARLRILLDNLFQNLKPVIQDLQASTQSQAYKTFFHDEANKPFLLALFTNISTGAVAYPHTDPPQPWAPYSPTAAPIFWTITQREQLQIKLKGRTIDAHDQCTSVHGTTAYNLWTPGNPNPIILICPYFYDAPPHVIFGDIPPVSVKGLPASNCLEVNRATNRFKRKTGRHSFVGFELTMYRMWILLEELAHVYYQVATGRGGMDRYSVNKVTELSPQDALANGPSYVYYAASEFPLCDHWNNCSRAIA